MRLYFHTDDRTRKKIQVWYGEHIECSTEDSVLVKSFRYTNARYGEVSIEAYKYTKEEIQKNQGKFLFEAWEEAHTEGKQ